MFKMRKNISTTSDNKEYRHVRYEPLNADLDRLNTRRSLIMKVSLITVALIILGSASLMGAFRLRFPLHASCKVKWTWPNTDCGVPLKALLAQIDAWKTDENCKNGGEKCLYSLVSNTSDTINAKHATPVKKYIDDLTFKFSKNGTTCNGDGFSTSETWYAVLDFGTNYCNLNNLITGAGLDKVPGYKETTDDSICTQFSTANCTVY